MKKKTCWRVLPEFSHLQAYFADLDKVFQLQDETGTSERPSDLIRIKIAGEHYYVKRYRLAGKGFRRFFGKPRIQSEWQNLLWVTNNQIATASVVAYGMEKNGGYFNVAR